MVRALLRKASQVFPTGLQAPVAQRIEHSPSKRVDAGPIPAGGTAERWIPVVGFEGWYDVSDLGRIRRRGVNLGKGSPRLNQNCLVHVLVARAFLGPAPSEKHEVNHKDGVKTNARPDNLEWVTRRENLKHSYRLGLRRSRGSIPFWDPDADHCDAAEKLAEKDGAP